ncbi:ester cyclase [Stenotrophomonas humi]
MTSEANKEIVRRFNSQVIAGGDREVFEALMADNFVNHTAPADAPNGSESMWNTFNNVLRPALSQLTVIIHDQVAEGDLVTTRKTIRGLHTGTFLGVAATGTPVAIDVIDIVRISDGKYIEHWGINTLSSILAALKA